MLLAAFMTTLVVGLVVRLLKSLSPNYAWPKVKHYLRKLDHFMKHHLAEEEDLEDLEGTPSKISGVLATITFVLACAAMGAIFCCALGRAGCT